ncbi:hypothetical protein LCGC14_0976710 [marine sediment metagenome]|uniref:LamG-like jellyroll fold domain-containing protein n=1 Tax=marine sediment metagenome TaxID=412755 RepID=A0A0F9QTF0_9ZZZZ
MTIALPGAPFPVTYRELWLPPGINENATLPTSVEGGHGLTLTGARKGTTADGVHFTGAITSNINCGAIHNAAVKLYISLRFKVDQDFSSASPADQFIFGKRLAGDDAFSLKLYAGDGKLLLNRITPVGGSLYNVVSNETFWEAGVWYHVLFSISDVAGVRLIVEGGVAQTNADLTATPNGGDFVIGDFVDPGAGVGFEGVIADVFCEEGVDLAAVEEYDLYAGIPPATVDNAYPLDEGRGVTAYDRGADGNNGTLDTSCTWAFGQVQQPVLSLDGINDVGISSAGVNISGALTLIWVGKMKSTYDGLSDDHYQVRIRVDGNNQLDFQYNDSWDEIIFVYTGNGNIAQAGYADKPAIDDYMIMIGVGMSGVGAKLFINGSLSEFAGNPAAIPAGVATAFIGRRHVEDYDLSKPLLIALIDGAFTDKQALAYSRYLKNVFNLPITI